MAYYPIIRNFANINVSMTGAEELRSKLSLTMPVEMLKFCADYYKNQLRRDPFADELQMLDMFADARVYEGSSLAITEFLTNDVFVAKTYADLLQKRKQIYPDLVRPITLDDAATVASDYIQRTKDPSFLSQFASLIENVRDNVIYPDATCVTTKDSAYRLRLLPLSNTALANEDALILVSPENEDTQDEFRHKIADLLCNKELLQYVKGVSTIERGGILHALLNITDGALVQLSSLSSAETSSPATVLCNGFWGCHIVRVAQHQWSLVTTLLVRCGVRAFPFASIKHEPKFVFVRDNVSFSLDTRFLRSLNKYQTACAKLTDESSLAPTEISFGGIGGGKCSYLTPDSADRIGEVVEIGSTACVAASAKTANAPFKTALLSVLAPVAALCASGVHYTSQTLSMALEFPTNLTDDFCVGNCMATLLGLYRAQTELGLAAQNRTVIRQDKSLTSPNVSVWALAKGPKKIATTFTKSGSFVFAVSPEFNSDGLPNFSALRQMLSQIVSFANEEKILSCRTLTGESITKGIRKMSHTHTCVVSNESLNTKEKLPLCILIESDQELPFCCIGKVHPYKRLPKAVLDIPERTDLIACEKPEIVMVSYACDNDAMALATLLEERGAHVSLFTNPTAQKVALSRAILTTQTLILCPNARLPQSKEMDFALDTLHRAGGIFLSLSKNITPEGFIPLKKGIDEEILEKICR